jgi:hypothetical protein
MAKAPAPAPQFVAPPLPLFQHVPPYPGPVYDARAVPYPIDNASCVSDPSGNMDQGPMANVIEDEASAAKSNIFRFGAFGDKQTGTLYNDLTGAFLFMSLAGNMYFLFVYQYETNAILALPIANLEGNIIFEKKKKKIEFLESKGHKIRLNVMDNQASCQIRQFLTKNKCNLLLVEPHNHHVNAAEQAIQTFKDHFVSALATTNTKFPLQLWDWLTPQVKNMLNLLCRSWINPAKSAHEALHCPYDWNRFPLAPPGCKAVIYKLPNHRGSWGSRGIDGWYLGLSINHYCCCYYFVPEMRAYCISGLVGLFSQHCQVPCLTWRKHLKGLSDKIVATLSATTPNKQRHILTFI